MLTKPINEDELNGIVKIIVKLLFTSILVNMNTVTDLIALGSDSVKIIVKSWEQSITNELIILNDKINNAEYDEIKQIAHSLKGISYQVGSCALGDMFKELEILSLDHDDVAIKNLHAKIIECSDKSIIDINKAYF